MSALLTAAISWGAGEILPTVAKRYIAPKVFGWFLVRAFRDYEKLPDRYKQQISELSKGITGEEFTKEVIDGPTA